MSRQIEAGTNLSIYDTTLRDGAQTPGVSLSLRHKLKIAERLDQFGMHYIEGGWPGANPTDVEFFEEAKSLELKNTQLTAFGSTARVDIKPEDDPSLEKLLRSERPILTIFGKSSIKQAVEALRTTPERNLEIIYETVKFLTDQKRQVFYDAEHFYDGYKENPKYALATLNAAVKGGASMVVLCDTNGGSTPEFVYKATKSAKRKLGEEYPLGIHAHNDGGLAVSNTLAAVKAGARQVQGTVNGAGERSGNVDLCVFMLTAVYKYGAQISGIDLTKLKKLADFVELENGLAIPRNNPYTGENAFTHKGGVHVDAVLKNPELYEHMPPETVGRKRKFEDSDQGGKANIFELARKHGFQLNRKDPRVPAMVEEMKRIKVLGEAQGYLLLHKFLSEPALNPFEVLKAPGDTQVVIDRGHKLQKASVKVHVNGDLHIESATGNGALDAFDKALRQALTEKYPQVADIELTDYEIPSTRKTPGTDASVVISTEFGQNGNRWTSVTYGTDEHIASQDAIIDSYKYFILKSLRGK